MGGMMSVRLRRWPGTGLIMVLNLYVQLMVFDPTPINDYIKGFPNHCPFGVGFDRKRNQLRNRLYWKCKHCDEIQFAIANPENKVSHLLNKHGITKDGNQNPIQPMDRYTRREVASPTTPPVGRQKEAYASLTTIVMRKPVLEALISLLVVCQVAFTLATNHLFIGFLKTLFPTIDQLLPKCSKTIRRYVIKAFERRKKVLKFAIHQSKSQIHFSFDLWTSPNHLALLGIVGHYIDSKGVNQSVSFPLILLLSFCTNFTSQQHLIQRCDSHDFLLSEMVESRAFYHKKNH